MIGPLARGRLPVELVALRGAFRAGHGARAAGVLVDVAIAELPLEEGRRLGEDVGVGVLP